MSQERCVTAYLCQRKGGGWMMDRKLGRRPSWLPIEPHLQFHSRYILFRGIMQLAQNDQIRQGCSNYLVKNNYRPVT
jgi:hypothetical protein